MKCPNCGEQLNNVISTKDSDKVVSRIYQCTKCSSKYMSVEELKVSERRKILAK